MVPKEEKKEAVVEVKKSHRVSHSQYVVLELTSAAINDGVVPKIAIAGLKNKIAAAKWIGANAVQGKFYAPARVFDPVGVKVETILKRILL